MPGSSSTSLNNPVLPDYSFSGTSPSSLGLSPLSLHCPYTPLALKGIPSGSGPLLSAYIHLGPCTLPAHFPALRNAHAHCAPSATPIAAKLCGHLGPLVDSVPTEWRLNRYSRSRAIRTFVSSAQLAICCTLLHCIGIHSPASLQLLNLRGLIATHLLLRLAYNLALEWLTSSPLRPFDPFPHICLGWSAVHAFVRHLRLGLCLVLLFFAYKT